MDDLIGKKRTPKQEELYWAYWHKLIDIRAKRDLTEAEKLKYDGYLAIAARLAAEQEAPSVPTVERLAGQHEGVIASIRRLTEAVEGKRNG